MVSIEQNEKTGQKVGKFTNESIILKRLQRYFFAAGRLSDQEAQRSAMVDGGQRFVGILRHAESDGQSQSLLLGGFDRQSPRGCGKEEER